MGLGAPEIIVILVIILVLFGGKKIPQMMKGLGQGIKDFKDSQNGTPAEAPVTTPVRKDDGV